MEKIIKPKLVFFQYRTDENLPEFVLLHRQQHVKCLSEFFDVTVINKDCDYQQICDRYQPDITLFESGVNYRHCHRLEIKNTHTHPKIPKVGLHNGDSWCEARAGFLSDMEHWGIETFFSICTTIAEHMPTITENLFVWPNFIDADICRDYGESKLIPIMLTGKVDNLYPWRNRINKIVSQYYPSLICPHLGYKRSASRMLFGEHYARAINASWVVPTCGTVVKEVVRKHFEIPGSKSCLLTEKTPAIEAAGFVSMENCIFADEHDVKEKLDYLFEHPDELEKITNAGYQLVHSNHTLKQRDQILQWFTLYKSLESNQQIIQTNPFGSLTVVEKSSGVKSSHIICNGLDIALLRQGDEKLWSSKYKEAEVIYLRWYNYMGWKPGPMFRLTLCNLYKGDAKTALNWIVKPIQYTLKQYKALDPDPIELAYLAISYLCLGNLDEAAKQVARFPLLSHPELDRTRWVIDALRNKESIASSQPKGKTRARFSIHQLPSRNFNEWIEQLCIMLIACQQFDVAETLKRYIFVLDSALLQEQSTVATTEVSINQSIGSFVNQFKKVPVIFGRIFKSQLVVKLRSRLILRTRLLDCLNKMEARFGYFLPYHYSQMRRDEFFHAVEKLVREEDIKTALIIGSSIGEGTTKAFLTGIQENPNKPTVFWISTSLPQFIPLKKQRSHSDFVKHYDLFSLSLESFSDKLRGSIARIKKDNKICFFDVVLIDGSELNNDFELKNELHNNNFILIDDISTIQVCQEYHRLITNSDYILVSQNPCLRNGYVILKKAN